MNFDMLMPETLLGVAISAFALILFPKGIMDSRWWITVVIINIFVMIWCL